MCSSSAPPGVEDGSKPAARSEEPAGLGTAGLMSPTMAETTDQEKSLATHVTELYELVLGYAKQETLDPVKSLGRFVGFGVAGSLLCGLGAVVLLLGGLRALQTETGSRLQGNWSWAPYAITAAGCALIIGVAMTIRARRPNRGGPRP
jgi:hypothetical protein